MQLVDKSNREILAGYQRILDAEKDLLHRWREPLLEIYARQRSSYEKELEVYRHRRAEFSSRLRVGIWLSAGILALGLIILPVLVTISELGDLRGPLLCFSPLLILGGLTGFAIVIVLWIWQRDNAQPKPPAHPLKSALIYPLLPAWQRQLAGSIRPGRVEDHEKGVYSFIARLQAIEPEAYMLQGLQLQPGKPIDIIVIGPRGIWVFNVIPQDGTIRWREGRWTRRQTLLRMSGPALTEIREAEACYDAEWRGAVESLTEALNGSLPELVARTHTILRIRGGLVFSHRKVKIDIPPGCPFNWGIIPFWTNKLSEVPPVAGFDKFTIFQLLDALVSRHRLVTGEKPTSSMLDAAEELIEAESTRIESIIASAGGP
jgi:hypothetical protein